MACENHLEQLLSRLYGELEPADDAELSSHLSTCAACRDELRELSATRSLLADAAPIVPPGPRVVVIARPFASRAVLAFAAGVFFAGLFAAGFGVASWRSEAQRPKATAATTGASGAARDPSGRLVDWSTLQAALDDRLAKQRSEILRTIARKEEPSSGISPNDLQAALVRMERKVDDRRAADILYVLDELAAAEQRSRTQIGQTRDALRYVALSRDPRVSEE